MNSVQKNFKRQIKQVEKEKLRYWKKEKYYDNATERHYIRYYDEHGTLMKTKEVKAPLKGCLVLIFTIIGFVAVAILAILLITRF